MENKTKIGIGLVVLAGVGYYFYNKSKSPITNVTTTNLPLLSDKYTKEQATDKALLTVKDWIKTYDSLPEDVLNQKSKNFFNEQQTLKKLKEKANPSRTDLMEISIYEQRASFSNNLSLKDAIKRVKDIEYQKIYNVLKDLYAEYPKTDVDKLMVILPKYLSGMMLGDDYKYSYDVYDGLSIDDKLFLSDTNFQKKFEDIVNVKYPKKINASAMLIKPTII
jgi:hypothetical protein